MQLKIISIDRIQSSYAHNAFTAMIDFSGLTYLAYRSGSSHVSNDGCIVICYRMPGGAWIQAYVIELDGFDLRDPKLIVGPKGELLLLSSGVIRPKGHPHTLRNFLWKSNDGLNWFEPTPIAEDNMWLWRLTYFMSLCYGFAYCVSSKCTKDRYVSLYRSNDGLNFDVVAPSVFSQGYPNEHAMLFDTDGKAWCLLRRDDESQTAMLGSAMPPYTDWEWRPLGVLLGGPQMLKGPDGRVWVGARLYDNVIRTSLCTLDLESARLEELLVLPSGGDCSYPDMVWLENGDMLMSYYSSHEGSSNVYVAHIQPDYLIS